MVIFNCVRSNNFQGSTLTQRLGFLTDLRRLNVAITRPKHFLFLVGNSKTLGHSDVWRAMIESCKESDGYFLIKERSEDYTDKMIANYIKEHKVRTEMQIVRDKLNKYWKSTV
jgi:superfamily I DNA and/or RNA helicase